MKHGGYNCSEYTPIKQKNFESIINKHIIICKSIFFKQLGNWVDDCYYYFDLNAGPGIDEKGRKGSPIIFLRQAIRNKIKCKAIFFEIEKYRELEKSISLLQIPSNISISIHAGNNKYYFLRYLRNYPKKRYGLLYSDVSGTLPGPEFDLISRFSKMKCYSYTDILINQSCSNAKRFRCANHVRDNRTLYEMMSSIDKLQWIIRKPYLKHQWSFFIASNWDNFPQFKELGFFKLNTKEGKNLMKLLDFSKKERANAKIKNSARSM